MENNKNPSKENDFIIVDDESNDLEDEVINKKEEEKDEIFLLNPDSFANDISGISPINQTQIQKEMIPIENLLSNRESQNNFSQNDKNQNSNKRKRKERQKNTKSSNKKNKKTSLNEITSFNEKKKFELEEKIPEEINYEIIELNPLSHPEIQVIYHISDLHIENNSNTYEEYNYVFDKLFELLKNEKEKKKILVITGDILHERTKLYTETILYTWEMLKKFAKLLPIIMIPGNHDINMRNRSKNDGLTGIIFDRRTNEMDIHYLLEGGLYKYSNILFCVHSLYDKLTINYNKIKSDNLIKIALYHGIVDGAVVDAGFEVSKNKSLREFYDYDYTLLGDIHLTKFLKPNIGYAGSLITQNYGEGDSEHGCIRWDLKTQKHEFIPIKNIYAYKVIPFGNFYNKVEDLPLEQIPSHGKLKIKLVDIKDPSKLHLIKNDIKKSITEKCGNVYITFEEMNREINSNKSSFNKISGEKDQNSDMPFLLNDYLQEKFKNYDIKSLYSYLIGEMNQQTVNKNQCRRWKILSIQWKNIFVYGPNNKVDFERLNNITGLVGKNSSGKSLFLEIILYLLYGRDSMKETCKYDFINKEENEFCGEIQIEVDNKIVSISRKGKVSNKYPNSFEDHLLILSKSKNDSSSKTLTEDNKRNSQKLLNDMIGKIEDVKKINFLLQNENERILNMKRKERKEYLYRILNINFMDEIYEKIKAQVKVLKKEKSLVESKFDNFLEMENYKEKINQDENSLKEVKNNITSCLEAKKEINDKIDKLNRELKPQKCFPKTRKTIYEENRKWKDSIEHLEDEMVKMRPKLKVANFERKNKKITKIIAKFQKSIKDENQTILKFQHDIETQNKNLNENLKKMVSDIGMIKTILEDVKNDKKVDKNQLNKINLDLINQISETNDQLNSKNSLLKMKMESNDKEKKKIEKLANKKATNLNQQLSIKKTLDQIREKKDRRKQFLTKIKANQELLRQYRENEIFENDNKNIEEDLKKHIDMRQNIENKYILHEQCKCRLEFELKKNKEGLIERDRCQFKIVDVTKNLQFFERLLEITSVNGFSYYLLNRYIHQIEEKMNEVFGVYFNRKIKVILEKDAVGFNIINEDNKICSSMGGCESLLFELSFRISIAKTMKIPLCNTLFIDEHLSVIDFDKRYEIKKVFDHINSYFEKIIVITHDDTIRNYVDDCLTIRRENKASLLNSDDY